MKKYIVPILAAGLAGCSSFDSDVQSSLAAEASAGCMYAGSLYSPGAVRLSMVAVSTGRATHVVDDNNGVLITCVADGNVSDRYIWQRVP